MGDSKMPLTVWVNIEDRPSLDWPEGLPIPTTGDEVMWRLNASDTVFIEITGREWQIGTNPRTGEPWTVLAISAKTR